MDVVVGMLGLRMLRGVTRSGCGRWLVDSRDLLSRLRSGRSATGTSLIMTGELLPESVSAALPSMVPPSPRPPTLLKPTTIRAGLIWHSNTMLNNFTRALLSTP